MPNTKRGECHEKKTDCNLYGMRHGDGKQDGRFDLVNIDACLMGSIEISLVLADYVRIRSCKTVGDKTYYSAWSKVRAGTVK